MRKRSKGGIRELIRKIFDRDWQVKNRYCLTALIVLATVFMITASCSSAFGSTNAGNTETVKITETKTISVYEIITYDIWKHINGVWQFGKAPGSDVTSSFTVLIGSKLPEGAKVTEVQGAYNSAYAGAYSANIVPAAEVTIKSFTDTKLTYSFAAKLNGVPVDIKKSTQAEEVEGYRYYIPVVFDITYTVITEKEVPKEEPGGDNDDDKTPIDQNAEITGEARLAVPEKSYEGHSVTAEDRSVFTVDKKTYGAARMYGEKLASNSFKSSGAGSSTQRRGETSAEVTFAQAGQANVLLTVTTKSGLRLTDKKEIEVLRTPNISSALGGTQKQNRKQTIIAEIATNPQHPLKELWIEIEKKGGGERVRLTYDTNGGKNLLKNSSLIKTRAIADNGSNKLFTRVKLEFLTKNSEETAMTYRIYAKDDRDCTNTVEKTFTVVPDKAPKVVIGAEKEQVREEQSSIAHVYAEDITAYDGDDAERVWYVREQGKTEWQKAGNGKNAIKENVEGNAAISDGGIRDASFGTWKAMIYEKTGVGKLDIRLEVTEKWTEETLPEYISESDRHSGSAETQVDIINIAPVVSLTSSRMKTANLLFLTAENKKMDDGGLNKTDMLALRNALFEKGISAKIQAEDLKSASELNGSDAADSVFKLVRGYGYGAEETFLEKGWYICGKNTLYTVDGVWTRDTGMTKTYNYNVGAPYKINAYDLQNSSDDSSTGNLKWTATVTEENLGHANISDIEGMALDDRCKYLLFRSSERTIIYDGETGAYTATLPLAFGDDNYAENGRIYTVREDGIYSADLYTGSIKKLYSGNICVKAAYCDNAGASRRINNEVHFFSGKGIKLMRGILSLDSETLRFEEIQPSQAKYSSSYTVIGIGADGKACIGQDGKSAVYIFENSGNEEICLSGWETGDGHDILPAYKNDGTFDYVVTMYNTDIRTGTAKSGYKKYYGIYMDIYSTNTQESGRPDTIAADADKGIKADKAASYSYVRKVSDSAKPGSGTDAAKAMYAVQIGNEVIVNNGDWATSMSDGSPLSNYYYTSFSQVVFDIAAGTSQRYLNGAVKYEELGIGGSVCEYGKVTDDYIISAYSLDTAGEEYNSDGNVQALSVARLPKTEDDEFSLYVNKFAPKKSASTLDIAAVIADAAVDTETSGNIFEGLKAALSAADNTLLTIEKGTEITAAAETISSIAGRSKYVKVSANEAGKDGKDIENTECGGLAELKKTYKLAPDTEYYYEFEYAGNAAAPIDVRAETNTQLPENVKLMQDTYITAAIQSEDFNKAEGLNDYFSGLESSRVHEGKYYGAEMMFAKDSGSNKAITDTSELTFEIEKGEIAILEFDYSMTGETNSPDEVYIDVNGERWYRNVNISEDSGTYTHPYLLPEGKNTVAFGARFYGKRPGSTNITIDNLKVIYLEKEESMINSDKNGIKSGTDTAKDSFIEAAAANADAEDSDAVPEFRKISGSIRTPQQIVAYAGLPMTYIRQQVDEPACDFIKNTKEQNKNDLEVTLPAGKKAVHTAITLKSSPADKYPVKWDFDGKKYSVNYKTTLNYHALQVPREFRVNTNKREGTIAISPGSLYRRGAGYGEIEMLLVDKIYEPIAEGRYFAEPPRDSSGNFISGDGTLYIQDETFNGEVTVRIIGTDVWYLKNFRLYHIENGHRIYEEDGNFNVSDNDGWQVIGGEVSEENADSAQNSENPQQAIVYKKGETIRYNVMYYDYETDPSKAQYWRYMHVPANDGIHPQAGKTLSAPIEQFYVDGKYTVMHWQEDSTGNVNYDKQSNIAEMTFYIEGGASAPWITSIETVPAKIKEGDTVILKIGVDDIEKDVLSLKTELYYNNKVIYEHQKSNITANKNGKYPYTLTEPIMLAEEGVYTAVCTVSDEGGTGVREYTFKAEMDDGIKGKAEHFPAWENARIEYNKNNPDSPRAANVFWAAEAFKLSAEVYGRPSRVTVKIKEYPQQKLQLAPQSVAQGADRYAIYSGSLFDSAISADLAKKCAASPGGVCALSFVFTAEYPGRNSCTDTVTVIIDDNGGSGPRIHRVF